MDCAVCRELVPSCFTRDDTGYTYVSKQPQNREETFGCREAAQLCPNNSIGTDGLTYDWESAPIFEWRTMIKDQKFTLSCPTINPTNVAKYIDD
jgi:ferredoxin